MTNQPEEPDGTPRPEGPDHDPLDPSTGNPATPPNPAEEPPPLDIPRH